MVHVPYMWGYGGNFVVLLPHGVSAFRFADGNTHDLETMILAGEAIRPFCTSTPAAVPPMAVPSAPLSAAKLQAQLPGNTFSTGGLRVFIAPGGVQYLAIGTRVDVGRWRITPDGLYCRAWTVADDGRAALPSGLSRRRDVRVPRARSLDRVPLDADRWAPADL